MSKNVRIALFVAGLMFGFLGAEAQKADKEGTAPGLYTEDTGQISFDWVKDDELEEPHSAMLFPVFFENKPGKFYMQFDLGSPYSMFYRPASEQIFGPDSAGRIRNVTFRIDGMEVRAGEIPVRAYEGGPVKDGKIIVGTIGMDLVMGKAFLLDYPNRRLMIGANAAALGAPDPTEAFVYTGKSILLPAVLRGKKTMLFFDTGSSAYPLLAGRETFEAMAEKGGSRRRTEVKSWDKMLTVQSAPTSETIEMNGHRLPVRTVAFTEGTDPAQARQMAAMGIGGMTGNKLFLENRLLIDMTLKRFSILD